MIAREGIHFILISIIITISLILLASKYDSKLLFSLSLVMGILTLFITFFFRDPQRNVRHGDSVLVAPADGRVIAIEEIDNHEFIGGKAVKISIFLSIFDVHINRVPATGKIDYVKYNPGKFFAAYKDKASHLNEQTEIGMTTESGQKIIFKQIAGFIARRIVCNLKNGDTVSMGDRFGMIRFGSRTELIIPSITELKIKVGDHVAGGKTIVGYLSNQPVNLNLRSSTRGSNVEL